MTQKEKIDKMERQLDTAEIQLAAAYNDVEALEKEREFAVESLEDLIAAVTLFARMLKKAAENMGIQLGEKQ